MALYFAEDARGTQSLEALGDAISSGRPGTIDKRIEGVFIGRFQWNPPHFWKRRFVRDPWRILEVREVQNLSVMQLDLPPDVLPPPR